MTNTSFTIDRYKCLHHVGRGGMADVFVAEDTVSGRRVALKFLRADLLADPGTRERFRREVIAARRVSGEHIVTLLDDDIEAETPYIVTEYIPGPTLDDRVRDTGSLGGEETRNFAIELALGLTEIHAADVVHRDLNPCNVLLGAAGPRIIDFGIAWIPATDRLTDTGTFVGTPAFTAPEQLAHEEIGPAADVYSWAATIAFAALGRRTIEADHVETLLLRVFTGAHNLIGLDPVLEPVVRASLARRPDQRPAAGELVEALRSSDPAAVIAASHPDPAHTVHNSERMAALMPARQAHAGPAPKSRPKRVRRWAGAAAAVTVLGAGTTMAMLANTNDEPAPGQPAQTVVENTVDTSPPTTATPDPATAPNGADGFRPRGADGRPDAPSRRNDRPPEPRPAF